MFKDYYQILGLTSTASKQEIKQAYRKLSLQWHPDKNPGVDETSMMQDINEAYKILNDDISRTRYDKEYREFNKQRESCQMSSYTTESKSWNYEYDVHDEDLKNDINNARAYAKDLVDEFLKSLKETSKVAAKGAWEGAKYYVYGAIILSILGLCIRACMESQYKQSYTNDDWQSAPPLMKSSIVNSESVPSVGDFQMPETWTKYYFANQSFSLSVPPTVELRHGYDKYVKRLNDLGLSCNTEDVVFQQKDLSNNSSEALSRYCRVMIQYNKGNVGDFPLVSETFPIDSDVRKDLREVVENEVKPFNLIGEPSYKWISIKGANAIETTYRRTGANSNTTACRMYLLFNDNEMVKAIVSYREQESDIWLPDLTNIIKTFRWE